MEWVFSEEPKNSCYAKIIVTKNDDIMRGIHILSPHSSEVIQGFATMIHFNLKYSQLKELIGIHPTIGEELLGFKYTKRENANPIKTGC